MSGGGGTQRRLALEEEEEEEVLPARDTNPHRRPPPRFAPTPALVLRLFLYCRLSLVRFDDGLFFRKTTGMADLFYLDGRAVNKGKKVNENGKGERRLR